MGAFPCGGESREYGQDFSPIHFQRQNLCMSLSPAFQAGCALRAILFKLTVCVWSPSPRHTVLPDRLK